MLARCRSSRRNWVVVAQQPAARGRGWIITHPIGTDTGSTTDTICGRSFANSGHYKPLCACTFVNPKDKMERGFLLRPPAVTPLGGASRRRAVQDGGQDRHRTRAL